MTNKKKDIDQGWAWVVLFAAFTSNGLYAMSAVSNGLFQLEFLEHFEGSRSYISLVCSIHNGLQLLVGIVGSIICNTFSIRVGAMLGSAIFSTSLVLSSFSSSFEELMLYYGIFAGCGAGIMYTSVSVITSHYFHEKRLIACGITFSSPGFGYLCGPSLVRFLIVNVGWRYAMAIMGYIIAQTCVLGALFFPIDEPKPNCCSNLFKCNRGKEDPSDDREEDPDADLPLMKTNGLDPRYKTSNSAYMDKPRFLQLHDQRKHGRLSESDSKHDIGSNHTYEDSPSGSMMIPTTPMDGDKSPAHSLSRNGFKTSVTSVNSRNIHDYILKDGFCTPSFRPENKFITSIQSLSSVSRRHLNVSNSLLWESHSSIQHLGTYLTEDVDNEEGPQNATCSPDLTVLKNKAFWCLTLSQFFLMCGYCINFIHYPSMIVSNGIDISVVPQLYMTQGVSLIFARLMGGLFCSHPDISILLVSFGCQMLLGTLVFCMPFLGSTVWPYHLFQVFFAMYFGGTYVVLSQIVVKILGLHHLATGFGLLMMICGVAFFATPTLAGWLYDITKSYNLAYHCAGAVIFAGAFFVLMIQVLDPKSFADEPPQEIVIEIGEIKPREKDG